MLSDLTALLDKLESPTRRVWRICAWVVATAAILVVTLVAAQQMLFTARPTFPPNKNDKEPDKRISRTAKTQRAVAEWALSQGAGLRITYDTRSSQVDGIDPDDSLPSKSFYVVAVSFKHRGASHIGDKELQHLQPLSFLNELILPNAKITDDGMRLLAKLDRLRNLTLKDTDVTDNGVKHFRGGWIYQLDLSGTLVTDDCVDHLLTIKNLTKLNLGGTKVSAKGLARLRRHFPESTIRP